LKQYRPAPNTSDVSEIFCLGFIKNVVGMCMQIVFFSRCKENSTVTAFSGLDILVLTDLGSLILCVSDIYLLCS
jgi:hypothetical protein